MWPYKKKRKEKFTCHFSMLVRVKIQWYTVYISQLQGYGGQLTHWLAILFPQNEMSDENVNLSEQTYVSIDHKERHWYILPAHTNAKKGLLLTSNLATRFTMIGPNLAGVVSLSLAHSG